MEQVKPADYADSASATEEKHPQGLTGSSMPHNKGTLAKILRQIDFGSSVAESDQLLETARVETSAFSDLFNDRVDLIPGTKGSGKSALYRIFVDFMPQLLLKQRKVVVAHGVESHGDAVFHAFKERFDELKEDDFVSFWCVYLISLARDKFLRSERYAPYLQQCGTETAAFLRLCRRVRVPQFDERSTLRQVLDRALSFVGRVRPKSASYRTPDGTQLTLDLGFDDPADGEESSLPQYVEQFRNSLDAILRCADLHLWIMVDRLDEIFARRTETETRALRGLLRTIRIFQSDRIRLKVFLRDDILDQITGTPDGFTALTHVTARQADRLRWSEEQILTLVVNRLFASPALRELLDIDLERLRASRDYRYKAFSKVFPPTVHSGKRQSSTLRWLYTHTMDGRGVVTPRDVIDLLTRAKQRQQDECEGDSDGQSDSIIGSSAIIYGMKELSKRKKETFLKAEFPHFWQHIEKFEKGKSAYTKEAAAALLGADWKRVVNDLEGIGFLQPAVQKGVETYRIPFLYREGLQVTQGLET